MFLSGMLPIVQLQLSGVSPDVDTVARLWGDLGDIRNSLPPLGAIKVQTTTSTCMYPWIIQAAFSKYVFTSKKFEVQHFR